MHPSLFAYSAIGAVGFALLSTIATKYRGDTFEFKHLGRDAVAGALLTAFLLTLVPDILPQLTLFSGGIAALSSIKNTISLPSAMEFDLQVGYPGRK